MMSFVLSASNAVFSRWVSALHVVYSAAASKAGQQRAHMKDRLNQKTDIKKSNRAVDWSLLHKEGGREQIQSSIHNANEALSHSPSRCCLQFIR